MLRLLLSVLLLSPVAGSCASAEDHCGVPSALLVGELGRWSGYEDPRITTARWTIGTRTIEDDLTRDIDDGKHYFHLRLTGPRLTTTTVHIELLDAERRILYTGSAVRDVEPGFYWNLFWMVTERSSKEVQLGHHPPPHGFYELDCVASEGCKNFYLMDSFQDPTKFGRLCWAHDKVRASCKPGSSPASFRDALEGICGGTIAWDDVSSCGSTLGTVDRSMLLGAVYQIQQLVLDGTLDSGGLVSTCMY